MIHNIGNYFHKYPQQLRYLVAGVGALAGEYGSFIILVSVIRKAPLLSNATSFLIGLAISFTLQRNWTFKKTIGFKKRSSTQIAWFFLLGLFNMCLSTAMMAGLLHFGLHPSIAKLIVIAIIISWNFMVMKKVIFEWNSSVFSTRWLTALGGGHWPAFRAVQLVLELCWRWITLWQYP